VARASSGRRESNRTTSLEGWSPYTAEADCEGGARIAQLVEHEPVKSCPGYDWVECGSCGAGWQVPHYAESVG